MAGVEGKLAVLFAAVSGSAKVREKLGETEALHAVDRCIKRMERAVEGFGGRLAKVGGDEVTVAFASAEEALQAAIEMQHRVADLPPVSGAKLAIRIGFAFGPASEDKNGINGAAVDAAAGMLRLAQPEQILASAETVSELPGALQASARDLGALAAKGAAEGVHTFELRWRESGEHAARAGAGEQPRSPMKMCVRYRGRAYLLDDKTPFLTLGRDHGNDLIIEDRKASRQHARIERRGDKFFYIDRSTNGSYVAVTGEQETLLRHGEMLLRKDGSICFGSCASDPQADCARYEHL